MSDMRALLLEQAGRLFTDLCTRESALAAERGTWPAALWDALAGAGLAAAATSEARGGPGTDFGDACALVRLAGAHAIPVPYAETLLAEQALAAAGLAPVAGPLSIAPVLDEDRPVLGREAGRWRLSGVVHRVPWARHAAGLVVVAEGDGRPVTVVVSRPHVEHEGWNYAREPRDTVRFDGAELPAGCVGEPGRGMDRAELLERGALLRCAQMAGAMETALAHTVAYAKERVQFGRPIAQFQAVQHQIAVLASHAAAASAAAQGAIDACAVGHAPFEIAAAKARVGEAAGIVAEIAHQVHAAMGFTHEHVLHRSTRRLWAWRDEFGSETQWATRVGEMAARVGGEALWAFITATKKSLPAA